MREKGNVLSRIKIPVFSMFIISLIVFLGCGILNFPKVLKPIEGNIMFRIHEGYEHYDSIGEPGIMLSMETKKIYPCCNWLIKSGIAIHGNKILIYISGIYVPKICLTALGPATSESSLDISNGEYLLEFPFGPVTDIYNLIITNSYIKVTKVESHFTEPEFNLYRRYPSNSFVYLCGTTTETSWICEDFLDTLLNRITLEEFQFPDSGRICYPCSSGGCYYEMPAKYFYYENEEDFEQAGEILKSYTVDVLGQYSGVEISLINWKNEKYYSWQF